MNARLLSMMTSMAVLSLWGFGCLQPTTVTCPKHAVGVDQLVGEYNANAAKVHQLWARVKIDLVIDSKPVPTTWGSILGAPNGRLLLLKGSKLGPHDFALQGEESGKAIFRMGSSTQDGVYYFWVNLPGGKNSNAYVGSLGNAGVPTAETVMLDPLGLVSLLMVTELPSDFTRLPSVAMTLEPKVGGRATGLFAKEPSCAYKLAYLEPQAGRIMLKREVYFNWTDPDQPRRPYRVDFVAPDGRRVMTASLKDYKPIPGAGPKGEEAVMPTDITLEGIAWPDKPAVLKRMHIVLSDLSTTEFESDSDAVDAAAFWDTLPVSRENIKVLDDAVPAPREEE